MFITVALTLLMACANPDCAPELAVEQGAADGAACVIDPDRLFGTLDDGSSCSTYSEEGLDWFDDYRAAWCEAVEQACVDSLEADPDFDSYSYTCVTPMGER